MKPPVIVILGPTASGKSDLAVKIAKKYDGEIISADSRQVYKGLDIGTGKITKSEMKNIKHHMIDVANPKTVFTVDLFKKKGQKIIQSIIKRKKLPIICGGTGLYIDSLLGNVSWPEVPPNTTLRKKLEKLSIQKLFKILQSLDPIRAENIDNKNPVRLIRAIEIAKTLGSVPKPAQIENPYNVLYIGLVPHPEKLKRLIHNRLIKRIKKGMVLEVSNLHKKGLSWKRLFDLGLEYRYISLYLQKIITKDEMITKLDKDIWQYSKRQMTWFKRNNDINWYNTEDKVVEQTDSLIKKFLMESKQ